MGLQIVSNARPVHQTQGRGLVSTGCTGPQVSRAAMTTNSRGTCNSPRSRCTSWSRSPSPLRSEARKMSYSHSHQGDKCSKLHRRSSRDDKQPARLTKLTSLLSLLLERAPTMTAPQAPAGTYFQATRPTSRPARAPVLTSLALDWQ